MNTGENMKLIEAIIRKIKLGETRSALTAIGVDHIREHAVIRRDHGKGASNILDNTRQLITFVDRVRLRIVVSDDLVGTIIEAIGSTARTGRRGDCRIYILPFAEAGLDFRHH